MLSQNDRVMSMFLYSTSVRSHVIFVCSHDRAA